jgi:hypothetical protein
MNCISSSLLFIKFSNKCVNHTYNVGKIILTSRHMD